MELLTSELESDQIVRCQEISTPSGEADHGQVVLRSSAVVPGHRQYRQMPGTPSSAGGSENIMK